MAVDLSSIVAALAKTSVRKDTTRNGSSAARWRCIIEYYIALVTIYTFLSGLQSWSE